MRLHAPLCPTRHASCGVSGTPAPDFHAQMTCEILLLKSSDTDRDEALAGLRSDPEAEKLGVRTPINLRVGRVAMHAVRESRADARAAAS